MSSIAIQGAPALPTRAEIAARLAERVPMEDLLTADDLERFQMNSQQELKPAAVLLLVIDHPATPTVLFTQRTANLADHAGQISFPGGRCDAGDESPERTALRELREEVGVPADRVDILGRLPQYRTSTGYDVTPVVGWAQPPLAYEADPREVADIFEVPLGFLLDAGNHRQESAFYRGRMRKYWAMPYGERFIWGATAGMLVTFQRVLARGSASR